VIKCLCDAIGKLKIAVIYIYCDYRDKDNQSATNIIGSFAKQLILQAGSIPAEIWKIYRQKEERHEAIDLETAKEIADLILPCFDSVYICIDALDECQTEPRRQLLGFLRTLTGRNIRLFLTGRSSVESELLSASKGMSISTIPIVANEEDIRLYLSEKFEQDRYPEAMGDSLRAEVANKIVDQAKGM
jgi:hypothetical protein